MPTIPNKGVTTLKQQSHCTEEIPISFRLFNRTQTGYLDTTTMIILHFGKPTDCKLVANTPVQLFEKFYMYNRTTGNLIRTGTASSLPVLAHYIPPTQHGGIMEHFVYRPVNIYSWGELQPPDHLNALLHSASAQAEVMALLGAQFQPSDEEEAKEVTDTRSTNIVSRGLISLGAIFTSPFRTWVFFVCAVISGYLFFQLVPRIGPSVRTYAVTGWQKQL